MSSHLLSTEFLAAASKELKEKRALRAAVDKRIAQLEEMLRESGVAVPHEPPKKPKVPSDLKGLDTAEACVWLMRQRGNGARMTSREIADGLAAVGYKRTTNQITAALNHRYKSGKANDIKREGLHWIYVVGDLKHALAQSGAASVIKAQAALVDAIRG